MKYNQENGKIEITANDRAKRAVRIHHPTLRNCVYTITQFSRKYPSPYPCPVCGITHEFKTIHLNLNEHGDVTITPMLYEKLKADGFMQELTATKETTPAPTVISLGRQDEPSIVMSREMGIIRVNQNGHR